MATPFVIVIVALLGSSNAGAAGGVSVDGTWVLYEPASQTWTITTAGGYGVTAGGTVFCSIVARQSGDQVTIVTTYNDFDPGYIATFVGLIAPATNVMTGTWTSNSGQQGEWSARRSGSAPTGTVPPATGPVGTGSSPVGFGRAAPIAARISTPGQALHDVGRDAAKAAIAVGALLLITFPANIFNQTFSAHYGEITAMIAAARRRLRRLSRSKTPGDRLAVAETTPVGGATPTPGDPGRVTLPWFLLVLLVGSILGGVLNPKFGLNGQSATNLVSTLIAFAFGAVVFWFIARWFRQRHKYDTQTYLRALPMGLGIALVCVLISRLSGFQPGYLYGVVVSISFEQTLEDRHNAHLTAISMVSTLAVALAAWFLWIPVNHVALDHPSNVLLAATDNVLGSIFIGGLIGSVVGTLPLVLLPGHTLLKWRRDAWALITFVAFFLLVGVELRPASGPTHSGNAPLVTVAVLFVFFGGSTFWMRWFFARRTARVAAADPPPATAAPH